VILHPTLRLHKPHLELIVGGTDPWQLESKNLLDEWQVDCLVDGEAEDVVVPLFEAAMRGEPPPARSRAIVPSSGIFLPFSIAQLTV
jgi:hypothetical protein